MQTKTGGRFDLGRDFGGTGRRLVLVDVENLLGRRYITRACASWAAAQVREVLDLRPTDQVVVGTSHQENLVAAVIGWQDARHVFDAGADGAERALLTVLTENVADRFTEVVVVSGDHIFTEALAGLAALGVATTVVAQSARLSQSLRMAAERVLCPQIQFFGPVVEGNVA
ncbi:NYN domain-containing protein [Cellulosimicrobium sp. TH-20]|uniref:NYN domain-containing protein n=1 Tax=Cellulosimicrobium sp. TH-20 TaxID=1980001 RepID=UPI001582F690